MVLLGNTERSGAVSTLQERGRGPTRPTWASGSHTEGDPPESAAGPCMSGRGAMDTIGAITELEAALSRQVALAGGDPAVDMASEALLAALGPAVRQLATALAEQAAVEIGAQLPDHRVDVVLVDGEPGIALRQEDSSEPVPDGNEARLTLRLPATLKSRLEEVATESGDSVNTYVVKALSHLATRRVTSTGRRLKGTLQT